MTRLAIIVPTRGRPGNVAKVLSAWDQTGAWEHADIVLVFDADDPTAGGYQDLVLGSLPIRPQANIRPIEIPKWEPMVHKLDAAARSLAGDYFALGFAGDDHLPRTDGWAERYLNELLDLGTGIVYGDDGYQGAKLCTEWAMTSDIVKALGRMVPAPVEHMYSDVSLLELGRAAGCIRHLPDVQIEHVHPYAGKAELDPQYKRVNSHQQFQNDRRIYHRWQRTAMKSDVDTVRALRPQSAERDPATPTVTTALGLRGGGEVAEIPSTRRSPPPRPSRRYPMNIPRRLLKLDGATPVDVCVALADLASQVPGDRAIVELGVYRGKTALMMAWGAQQGGGAHVWSVDAWDLPGNTYGPPFTDTGTKNWARYNVKAQGLAARVTLVQAFSADAAREWDGPRIGMMFIDADHSYEGARLDVSAWTPHLADDAVLAFDDYGHPDWPGVAQAVDDMVAEGILEPIQMFHGRMAVTRLGSGHPELVRREQEQGTDPAGKTEPVIPDQEPTTPEGGTEPAGKTEPVDLDPETERAAREQVRAGEIPGVTGDTTLDQLTVGQMRELAKARRIVLGIRKDKRAEALEALRAGR